MSILFEKHFSKELSLENSKFDIPNIISTSLNVIDDA